MSLKRDIDTLANSDNLITLKQLKHFCNTQDDDTHVERNQQQRGISNNMILIALNYGLKKRSYQDFIYTLTDRNLLSSVYKKHISKLRGLTIVGNWEDSVFVIITCFWDYTIKSRKRY
jgi:hypothetical protein